MYYYWNVVTKQHNLNKITVRYCIIETVGRHKWEYREYIREFEYQVGYQIQMFNRMLKKMTPSIVPCFYAQRSWPKVSETLTIK